MAIATYTIQILNVKTSEIREFTTTWEEEEDYALIYMWEEGNYSCDCNRDTFFNGNLDAGIKCGHTKYKANLKDKDGKWLHREFGVSDGGIIIL